MGETCGSAMARARFRVKRAMRKVVVQGGEF